MIRTTIAVVALATLLACVSARVAPAEDVGKPAAAVDVDAAAQKKIDGKVAKLLKSITLDDADKSARVKVILGNWLWVCRNGHEEHNAESSAICGKQWNAWPGRLFLKGREFAGEVIAAKIDGCSTRR